MLYKAEERFQICSVFLHTLYKPKFKLPLDMVSKHVFLKKLGGSNGISHYIELGIQPFLTVNIIGQTLRSILANELKAHKTRYLPFEKNVDSKQYENFVDLLRQPGVFAEDMGDLMVKALANALNGH